MNIPAISLKIIISGKARKDRFLACLLYAVVPPEVFCDAKNLGELAMLLHTSSRQGRRGNTPYPTHPTSRHVQFLDLRAPNTDDGSSPPLAPLFAQQNTEQILMPRFFDSRCISYRYI